MKYILWGVGILLTLVLAIGIIQTLASERVELVELHTTDEEGEEHTTRLWIVDTDGSAYLRGDDRAGWVNRLKSNNSFRVTRNEVTSSFTFASRPDQVETINTLMREKYTWGDEFIEWMLGGRQDTLAIELKPTE